MLRQHRQGGALKRFDTFAAARSNKSTPLGIVRYGAAGWRSQAPRRCRPGTVLALSHRTAERWIMSRNKIVGVFCLLLAAPLGCQETARPTLVPPARARSAATTATATAILSPADLKADSVLREVAAMNERFPIPEADYRAGSAEPLEFESDRIKKTPTGYVIELPSGSPVPTPTVYQRRLYVSGGFSSTEYYCFDARDGAFLWGAQLDDDGPSSAVPYQDSIYLGCESCTLFALDAKTGKMRWSWWLGDPLLSTPMVTGGRVFAVFPDVVESDEPEMEAAPKEDPQSSGDPVPAKLAVRATHVVACFDAASGTVLWRRRIGSDCMSSPVAAGGDVFVAALDGTVYQFAQSDGELRSALAMRATSAPVIVEGDLLVTRRADAPGDKNIAECIARHDASSHELGYVAALRSAPYLDQQIQRASPYTMSASPFENSNGIGGGFGGGFPNVPPEKVGEQGLASPPDTILPPPDLPTKGASTPQGLNAAGGEKSVPADALAATQLQAAANIGLGNVSTIQVFQGSRLLYDNGRLVNCMGDAVVCIAAKTGKTLWSTKLDGELEKTGGHLATAPVAAGGFVFLATVSGKVLQIDRENGAVAKTYDIGSPLRSPPAIDDGRIYVGTQDGKVVCIDTRSCIDGLADAGGRSGPPQHRAGKVGARWWRLTQLHLPQELLRLRPAGRVENLLRRAFLDNDAVHDHMHLVRRAAGKAHRVRHDQHRLALPRQVGHHRQHLGRHLRIERARRLVEQNQLWVHGQRPRDRHALLLASGKLVRHALQAVAQAHAVQKRPGFGHGHLSPFTEHVQRGLDHVLQDGEVRKKIELLEHHPHHPAHGVQVLRAMAGLRRQFQLADANPPRLKRLQAVDAPQHRALARAGGADQDAHASRREVQRDALEHLALTVAFHQGLDVQERVIGGCRARGVRHAFRRVGNAHLPYAFCSRFSFFSKNVAKSDNG
ncbi:MAG: PQQ-binding-like beta-propeller repeat protein [Planctomycetia bacterium]|nr:PQQ-binding-like beta-propeller repeat protein [Planctomycetia bacterium]